ncbi:hypothetical protein L1987_20727 [Smallanthus sonchifolius]|uniref:Uncharacterized protein n=1 Tax=Smallanthus sonchifolius TaxID=185202 RepID=A0ACB9IS05_9ASTR|nr:hypothetical protein L1987_20727 [Smallanthus sonchifolius]
MLAYMIRRHDLRDAEELARRTEALYEPPRIREDEQQKVEAEQRKLLIKESEEQLRRIEALCIKVHDICANYQREKIMDKVQLPSSQSTAQVPPPVQHEFSYYEPQFFEPVFPTDIECDVEVNHLSSLESGKYPTSSYIDHKCVDDTHLTASSSIHNSFIPFDMSHLLWEDVLMQDSSVEDTQEDTEIVDEIEDAEFVADDI